MTSPRIATSGLRVPCVEQLRNSIPGLMEDIAVTKFREYLRVDTEQPNPDYAACQNFLFHLADELGIQRRAVEDQWKYDPYSAYKDENGDIYGRGAQDMKCVGSQYFEAIRRHFQRGQKQWLRTIHIVWGPDEEIAGPEGMAKFCHMDEFRELNIGFVLDEGIASETDTYKVFYAERCSWWVKITCHGSPGHGSKFIENTAAEKLNYVMNKALAFREQQKNLLKSDSTLTLGDVTTLNLTILEGGVQTNVLPEKFEARFDIRITPTTDFNEFEQMIASWCKNAGEDVTYEFLEKDTNRNMTPTTADDPWWSAFEGSLKDQQCKFTKEICSAATDSRYIREVSTRLMEDIAVTKFREYLRVDTEQPNPDYAACQNFLFHLADELGVQRHAVEDQWKYDPYSAYKDENGDIYGRGAQDMKCVGSQYFEAIRRHFQRGQKQWLRTIHIVWGPDEEIAGPEGMAKFCHMDEFRELNIGFVLDEGVASETDTYKVFYAERCSWWVKITCHGSPGHGSKFIENTAAEKLNYVMNKALAFREQQKNLLKSDSSLTLGDVTTLNLTILEGGVQTNVLPEKFEARFDIRITPTTDFDEFEQMIASWCKNAGEDVTYEFLEDQQCKFTKEICSAATDSRYIRELGYRSIGFLPIINTPQLLHDHNEYLNERTFLRGVEIYETLIQNLANVQE
ncbi:hypothetical protein GCK32_002811 [Trichostrongylus colubriformis]|uniref:Peptidase M20 dimerisation domain-containing protein n=1 Tax=Trichostrongylus colubriformis TaxID=6319 RepID=A0AAN8FZA0_TRICO